MDLRNRLTGWALRRPHVLLVAAPGSPTLRWDVEASLQRRGWPHATSPADTDLVLTAGELGAELGAAADLLWTQVPQPRHRAAVLAGAVEETLDQAIGALLADAEQGAVSSEPHPHSDRRAGREESRPETAADGDAGDDTGGHDMGGDVAGLPMAGGGPDRDGLELDALTVSLGPVLPGWPTGLVVTATLQGDVLTDVRATVAGPPDRGSSTTGAGEGPWSQTLHALDALERVLVVAGWTTAAREAARLRADVWATDSVTPTLARRGRRLTTSVRRSRTLAWSLRDLRGALSRVGACCDTVEAGLDGSVPAEPVDPLPHRDLPALIDGLDVGSARLVMASLPLDLTAPVREARP